MQQLLLVHKSRGDVILSSFQLCWLTATTYAMLSLYHYYQLFYILLSPRWCNCHHYTNMHTIDYRHVHMLRTKFTYIITTFMLSWLLLEVHRYVKIHVHDTYTIIHTVINTMFYVMNDKCLFIYIYSKSNGDSAGDFSFTTSTWHSVRERRRAVTAIYV